MAASKIALFIDADNISAKNGRQIIEALQERGDIFIRRIYGNWEKTTLHGWNSCILDFSLKPVQQNDFVTGKNATDMSLTIDAMDVLHEGKADTFALVSNDSDFTPLVIRLREGGVNIIGMGMGHASNAFRAACTEFIELDANPKSDADIETSAPIVKPTEVEISTAAQNIKTPAQIPLFDKDSTPPEKILNPKVVPIDEGNKIVDAAKVKQLHDTLTEIFKSNAEPDGYLDLGTAGTLISQKNLSVKDSGHSSLSKFIAAFPDRYEIIFPDDIHKYRYRCIGVKPNPQKATGTTKVEKLHAVLEEIAKNNAEPDGYVLLSTAGTSISKKNLSIKGSGYSSLKTFIKAFPNRYEFITRNKTKDYYRCVNVESKKILDKTRLEQLHAALKELAKNNVELDGYVSLGTAGKFISEKNLSIKSSEHSSLNKFIAAFPDRYEIIFRDDMHNYYYRCIDVKPNSQKATGTTKVNQLHAALEELAKNNAEPDGYVSLSDAGEFISKKNLSIKDSGYSSLSKFIKAFPDHYKIIFRDDKNNHYYRCVNVKPSKNLDKAKLEQLHAALKESAESHADSDGFSLLNYAGQTLKSKSLGFGVKDFGFNQLRDFVSAFPNRYEILSDDCGQKFRYRCK